MANWNSSYRSDILESESSMKEPPELPLHFYQSLKKQRQPHRGRLFKKMKRWWSQSSPNLLEMENLGIHSDNEQADDTRLLFDNYPSSYKSEDDVLHNCNYDSAKTFLTGNNTNTENMPKFPVDFGHYDEKTINNELAADDGQNNGNHSIQNKDEFCAIHPMNFPDLLSSRLCHKRTNLYMIKKRLNTLAGRKNEVYKSHQKLLKELGKWSKTFAAENNDTAAVIKDVYALLEQDMLNEQKVAHQIEAMVKSFNYICLRETELLNEQRTLNTTYKQYEFARNKKGDEHEMTVLSKEKLYACQKSFEVVKSHFQQSLSVTTRQLFNSIGLTYYEAASDVKDACSSFLKSSLQALEVKNEPCFDQDLNIVRLRRLQKQWSNLSPSRKKNPQAWSNMVSGLHDNEDSLLRNIYKGLPDVYSPVKTDLPKPNISFYQQGKVLDETFSEAETDKLNLITTNQYFVEKSSTPLQSKNIGILEPNNATTNVISKENKAEDPRSPIGIKKMSNIAMRKKNRTEIVNDENESQNIDAVNGYILNFGDISHQFEEAENQLEENKWV